jgi:hypothetical protein
MSTNHYQLLPQDYPKLNQEVPGKLPGRPNTLTASAAFSSEHGFELAALAAAAP